MQRRCLSCPEQTRKETLYVPIRFVPRRALLCRWHLVLPGNEYQVECRGLHEQAAINAPHLKTLYRVIVQTLVFFQP